jgi:Ran GTPase-activating protein (RanGAP) involved in mRNA processing and transport
MDDEQIAILAKGLAENREHLPLSTFQLSFNMLTPVGLEILLSALWGSRHLKVLKLDNNMIGDKGANLISISLASMKLTSLDVGFNSITANGMRLFMKAIAENSHIQSLAISGNTIDCASAKAVAYALAYNSSLVSLFLDQCHISNEGRRHITAGIVSNSRTSLQVLKGFMLGGEISI